MKCSISNIFILSITITTGCTTTPDKPKQHVIVGSGTMYEQWQKSVLEKCTDKAAEVTMELVVKKSKEGYVFMEQDVINIHKYLTEKCSRNSGIVI